MSHVRRRLRDPLDVIGPCIVLAITVVAFAAQVAVIGRGDGDALSWALGALLGVVAGLNVYTIRQRRRWKRGD